MKKIASLLTVLLLSFFVGFAQQNGDDILGVWETGNGKAQVKITKVGNYYFGRIVWLKTPLDTDGKPKLDKNNQDPSKKNNPILGLQLVGGFEFKGNNLWENGTIYDPETGKTYNCKITMTDINNMNIRGFIGISMFGRTDTWKRVESKK